MDEKHIIELQHLSKTFDNKKVLDDISFYVKKGEFITLLGPSGCGKSTILRMIAGFLSPDEGNILLDGKDISGVPPYERPLNTVFQNYALFPHLDVYDNIAFGLKLKKIASDKIDAKVRKALKMVSMTDYEDRDVTSLSGGQQQRVAIARAIVNQPKVLLLDEPLAALDLKMRKDMQLELKEMHSKLGITFIYVTHDQEEALTLSDTIVVMNEGKIQQIGTPTDIYNEPQNSFVADFIGESNILNAKMIRDRRVEFLGHEFECVDEGFGENVPVDIVIRPEDIYIMKHTVGSQFSAVVKSCIFKGVHYEMTVETPDGYELLIQDYNAFEVGTTVGLLLRPDDIQVMKKEREYNSTVGEIIDENHIRIFNTEFDCVDAKNYESGDMVNVQINFNKVDLLDYQEDGKIAGEVRFILYKGNHYHLTIMTEYRDFIWVDTNDIWDKGDLVGINIAAKDIKINGKISVQ